MTTKTTELRAKGDAHLANMLNWCREELRNNKPIPAYEWLRDIEKYLMENY